MHYAKRNRFGSDTSTGFADTWEILSFRTRAERESWVRDQSHRIDVSAVTRKDAEKMARFPIPLHFER